MTLKYEIHTLSNTWIGSNKVTVLCFAESTSTKTADVRVDNGTVKTEGTKHFVKVELLPINEKSYLFASMKAL